MYYVRITVEIVALVNLSQFFTHLSHPVSRPLSHTHIPYFFHFHCAPDKETKQVSPKVNISKYLYKPGIRVSLYAFLYLQETIDSLHTRIYMYVKLSENFVFYLSSFFLKLYR